MLAEDLGEERLGTAFGWSIDGELHWLWVFFDLEVTLRSTSRSSNGEGQVRLAVDDRIKSGGAGRGAGTTIWSPVGAGGEGLANSLTLLAGGGTTGRITSGGGGGRGSSEMKTSSSTTGGGEGGGKSGLGMWRGATARR